MNGRKEEGEEEEGKKEGKKAGRQGGPRTLDSCKVLLEELFNIDKWFSK